LRSTTNLLKHYTPNINPKMGKNFKQNMKSGPSSNTQKGKTCLRYISVSMTGMQTFFIIFSLFLSTHSSTYFTEPLLPQQKNALQLLPQSFLKSCTNLFSPFNKKTVSSGEIVMLATTCDKEFCVFDENFETVIGYGKSWFNADQENECITFYYPVVPYNIFPYKDENHYIESILEAQNIKGCKKYFVFLRYIVTIPFIKYLQYASIIIHKFLDPMFSACAHKIDKCFSICIPHANEESGSNSLFWQAIIVLMISAVVKELFFYFYRVIAFHIKTLPFHALTLPIELLCLERQYISLFTHCAFRLAFFFPYSFFFPKHVDTFLVTEFLYPRYITFKIPAFEIQPTLQMFSLPFLIERKRTWKFYALFFFYEILYSLLLIFGFQKWFPQQVEGEYF